MTIHVNEVDHGSVSNINVLSLTFESTENTTDFTVSDVICEGGTLSNFQGSGTTYTAVFTSSNQGGEKIVRVSPGAFHDEAGNGNIGGNSANDGAWTLVLRHNSTGGVFFTEGNVRNTNSNNPSASTFSILDQVEEIGNVDNTFKFKIHWPEYNRTNIWSQNCNPVVNVCTDATERGYIAIEIDEPIAYEHSTQPFVGLMQSSATHHTFLDGLQSGWWFYAIGAYGSFGCNTCFPSWSNNRTQIVELYVWSGETSFEYTFDSTPPTVAITYSNGASGFSSNDATLSLTFTLSEISIDFTVEDIDVTGANLSEFSQDSVLTKYTAVLTPEGGDGEKSVMINGGRFSDSAGNENEMSSSFLWTYDTTRPEIVILSDDVESGSYVNTFSNFSILFQLSEQGTSFQESDAVVVGATFASFTATNDTNVFSAVVLPNNENDVSEVSIFVPDIRFVDQAGNTNSASETFRVMIDTTNPDIVISSSHGESTFHSYDDSIRLIFTIDESLHLEMEHVTVSGGGSLSDFGGLETEYMATFTPSGEGLKTIVIHQDTVSDAAGNGNGVSNTFEWTYDATSPTILIAASEDSVESGYVSNRSSIDLNFTVSENTNFQASQIECHGGSLYDFKSVGNNVYTATFLSSGANGLKSISVTSGTTSDLAGNKNIEPSNTFKWTLDDVAPYITVSCSEGYSGNFHSNHQNLTFTFMISENVIDFHVEDVTVIGGTLSLFEGSGMKYTSVFSPNSTDGVKQIVVASGKIHDHAGNTNFYPSPAFEFVYDSTSPAMSITSSSVISGMTSTDTNITLFFYASESIKHFYDYDISVLGGTISDFEVITNGRNYTAVLSPAVAYGEKITIYVHVPASSFQDVSTNENIATSTFIWTYDTSPPPESSSFNDFLSSNEGIGIVAGFAVLVIIIVVGVTVMMKSHNSVSKETLNVLSHKKSRRPSHALDTYDEENAISNESTNVPAVQQLHDL